jgi:hypothetical protein
LLERTITKDGIHHNIIIGIKAVNTGHRDVKLEYAGLITKSKKYFVVKTHKILPDTLRDGDSITIRVKLDDAEKWLRDISQTEIYILAYVKDVEGVFYKTSHLPDVMVHRKMAKKSWIFRK